MIENHSMDRLVKDVLMMELVMHTEKNDTMFHTEKTGMLMLVVEIYVGSMTADDVDKLTCSSDDVQPKQVDLRCAHALYFDILHKSLSRSFNCKSILPPWKQARKIYYWDLTSGIRARGELLKRRIYRSDLTPFLTNSKEIPNLISLSKMFDHEEETINEENAHPKNFISSFDLLYWNIVLKGNNAKSMTTDNDGNLKIRPPVTAEEHQKIKPEPEDVNIKFLWGLPPSWSSIALILKTKGGLNYISFDDLYNKLKFLEFDTKGYSSGSSTLSNDTFISTTGSSQGNLSSRNGGHTTTFTVSPGSSSYKGSSKSKCSIIDDVIYSFFANHEIDQHLVYEDLDQMNKEEFEEYDLKHQMAMLSIKVHRFKKKHRRKIKFNGRENARSLENFGMIAGIKIESYAELEGEVVSANDAIPA
nr:hypothetical protein [Tanacetum cinerariifolium]